MTPGAYDDDRLLAAALGLDPDPELLTAAAQDDDLGRRLDAMRADVAAVAVQVRAAAPDPGPGYADLADPRWAELSAAIAAGTPAQPERSRSGLSRWLRVLAPVAAVLVAVAVGVGVLQHHGGSQSTRGLGIEAQSDQTSGGTTTTKASSSPSGGVPFIKQIDSFGLVVLARARAATGAIQSFDVVRVLKGKLRPDTADVHLRVAENPADPGRLHILMLEPLADSGGQSTGSSSAEPSPGTLSSPTATPAATPTAASPVVTEIPATNGTPSAVATPWPSGSALPEPVVEEIYGGAPMSAAADTTDFGSADPVTYSYRGDPAMARELPKTADASSIQLK